MLPFLFFCFFGQIPDDHLEGLSLWTETGSEPSEVVFPNGVGLADTDIVLYLKAEHTVACNNKVGCFCFLLHINIWI